MIASTKLAKAQRAMQAGKEYGLANKGQSLPLYEDFIFIFQKQRSLLTSHLTNQPQTSSSSSFPLTKVFAVVSTPQFPKLPDALSTTHRTHLWLVLHPMTLQSTPLPQSWSSVTNQKPNSVVLFLPTCNSLSTKSVVTFLLLRMRLVWRI